MLALHCMLHQFQGCSGQTPREGKDLPCTYLAHHELKALHVFIIILLCASIQALLGDACLLEQTLQALVTPELLPGFLVAASKHILAICLFETHLDVCRT